MNITGAYPQSILHQNRYKSAIAGIKYIDSPTNSVKFAVYAK